MANEFFFNLYFEFCKLTHVLHDWSHYENLKEGPQFYHQRNIRYLKRYSR